MIKMSDARLNYLCDLYIEQRLIERGVLLESFLQNPDPILDHFHIPLRHPARNAADPLHADDPGTEVRGGQLCEKLRHGPILDRPTGYAQRFFGRLQRSRG